MAGQPLRGASATPSLPIMAALESIKGLRMTTKKQLIVKMYKWKGLKYGAHFGLLFGLAFCFFEPETFGPIYITMPISMVGFAMLFSAIGFLFFPLLKSSFVSTGEEPSDKEIMDFYGSKSAFWGGTAETKGGAGDYGSGDGGSGGD